MSTIVDQKKYADFQGARFDPKAETFESFVRRSEAAFREFHNISQDQWKDPKEVESFYRIWTNSLTHRQVTDKDGSKPFAPAAAKKWQELVQNAQITALATYTERAVQYRNAFAIWEAQSAQAGAGAAEKSAVEKKLERENKMLLAKLSEHENGKGRGGGGRGRGDHGRGRGDGRGDVLAEFGFDLGGILASFGCPFRKSCS